MPDAAEEQVHALLSQLFREGEIADYSTGLVTSWSLIAECIDGDGDPGYFVLSDPDGNIGEQLKHAAALSVIAETNFRRFYEQLLDEGGS